MAEKIDRGKILKELEGANTGLAQAVASGKKAAQLNPQQIYLLGCGAASKELSIIKYWFDHLSQKADVWVRYPAEFVNQNPPTLNENTYAVLASHSGTTPETVHAAEFLKEKSIPILAVTSKADSPLAKYADQALLYGESNLSATVMTILFLGFMGGYLKEIQEWPLFDELISSLENVPDAVVDALEANEAHVTEYARRLKDDTVLPVVASGPSFSTGYIIGSCILTEALRLHGYPVQAAEFFHGALEVVRPEQAIILLHGEDPSRPISERVQRFCKRYTERLFVFDSRDYEMKGISNGIRPYVAPIILQGVLRRLTEHLSVWHERPLTSRRYYRKVEY